MSGERTAISGAKRLVVKVGSSSLTGADARLDEDRLISLVDALSGAHAAGRQVVLVTSGSIASGLAPLGLSERPRDLATAQATASVGQGLLMAAYTRAFTHHGITVGQVLLTADDLRRRGHYGNARRALERLLELGVVPIVNENDTVATEEIRFGDNDRLAALVSLAVAADALVLLTDVDGLYSAAPGTPGAKRIAHVASMAELDGVDTSSRGAVVGTGGMVTKLEAARLATQSGVAVVLAAASDAAKAVAGDDVGTVFDVTGKRSSERLQWLAHTADAQGQLVLDAGAVAAVRGGRASLLAAGVSAVRGEFESGDPVDLVGPDGAVVARGFAKFASHQIPAILGLSTQQILDQFGPHLARELVHVDDLVVVGTDA